MQLREVYKFKNSTFFYYEQKFFDRALQVIWLFKLSVQSRVHVMQSLDQFSIFTVIIG